MVKRNKGEYKDEQENRSTFIITTSTAAQVVCVVEGEILRERTEAENKGKRENSQVAANREKKSET